jgi:hypothetical protein
MLQDIAIWYSVAPSQYFSIQDSRHNNCSIEKMIQEKNFNKNYNLLQLIMRQRGGLCGEEFVKSFYGAQKCQALASGFISF